MPASLSKSKGAGTIVLVLVLFLGVAGASAFFIHKVLNGEDPLAVTRQNASESTQKGGDSAGMTPGDAVAQRETSPPAAPTEAVPSGQFVVPPAGAPDVFAELPPEGAGQAPLSGSDQASGGGIPPTFDEGQDAYAGIPAEPAPNLLLVPGTIEPLPSAAREDAVVRPAFVDDIAAFLAQNYWPKNTHPSARQGGITTASLQWANLRYGAEMQNVDGRRGDSGSARRAILGYVLDPVAVGRIYGLYADGFLAALHQEADKRVVGEGNGKRSLTAPEKREMFSIYAGFSARIATALEQYTADSSMPQKVQAYASSEQAVQEANRVYMESMIAFEEATERGDNTQIAATQLRMDKEAATYQKRIRERETTRNALVGAMSKDKNARGSDTLVYAAFWAYRRGGDRVASLMACAKALGDMSAKLTAAARQIQ